MAVFSSLSINSAFMFLFFIFSFGIDSNGIFQSIGNGKTLVSSGGRFELGFFSPGNSKNRYLGIWYKNIPIQTVVWVANRCDPIPDSSGLLTMNTTGNLVLLYRNESVVWSTSLLKQARKPIAQLLDSGNLVLRDGEDRNSTREIFLWQSFDHPTDTLLPGMKFGWDLRTGLNRRLSAWKTAEDPCLGDFSYAFEIGRHTYHEAYLYKGTEKYYRAGPWNGIGFSGSPELRPNLLFKFDFVDNEDELYYMYSLTNDSIITRIVLNQTTTSRERHTWIESDQNWRLYSSAPRDHCDDYGLCGTNGNCIITENPVCQCLKGFKPKSQEKWNFMDWSEGCVRNTPLNCLDRERNGFEKFAGIKLPAALHSWVNKSMNTKECREKCLSNCSCMAYSNSDIRGQGSGCILWFGDLIDVRKFPLGGQDLYIRMPASELGEKAKQKMRVVILVAIVGAVSGMLLLLGFCIWKRTGFKEEDNNEDQGVGLDQLPLFDLSTIMIATDNFSVSNKLGQGGFGPVYKGKLEDGQEIAVKRLSNCSGQGVNEFKNEVVLISKLQHRNLVKLLGYCIHREEKLLIYEYMPNKSLDFFIFDQMQGMQLNWPKRFQIICGIARGLLYLHQDSRLRIVHRDLKTNNVLLDDEMNPKISDFGMARTFGGDQIEGNTNIIVGTYGYMAPEYAYNGLFSTKSDIFSFGVMVLEIVSGKRSRCLHPQLDGLTLTGHAWKLMNEGREIEMLDSSLRDSHSSSEVLRCIHVGLLCVQQRTADRPNMSSVVVMLGSESVLPQPKKPGYFMETDPPQGCHDSSPSNKFTISVLEAR
ncbi:hypothetical protein TIFTF001_031032 [Ficus carica]|uniref:Receptor-like serine/threonine-protein kinase n=1 Tax=Ficus carica TaxID=3494 RepID=A0AA88DUE0_FICCA|nr:hypothetical protein TIFTF001_031032 [Ficus carica]